MSDIKFEIVKKIGVLSKSDKGWAGGMGGNRARKARDCHPTPSSKAQGRHPIKCTGFPRRGCSATLDRVLRDRKDEWGNDRDPKYDIREWSPDGQTMSKGVTLSKEKLAALRELLNKMEA